MIRATSIIALESVLSTLGDRQREVLIAFKHLNKPCNNLMISKFLGLPINSITPRCQELRDRGILIYYETKACPYTGRASRFYIIKDWIKGVLNEQM